MADLFNRWKQGGGGDETHRKWVLLQENADGKKETHKNREMGEREREKDQGTRGPKKHMAEGGCSE